MVSNGVRGHAKFPRSMPDSSAKQEYLVGVDLGGTKILAGVFTNSIKCLGKVKTSTKALRGPDAVIDAAVVDGAGVWVPVVPASLLQAAPKSAMPSTPATAARRGLRRRSIA